MMCTKFFFNENDDTSICNKVATSKIAPLECHLLLLDRKWKSAWPFPIFKIWDESKIGLYWIKCEKYLFIASKKDKESWMHNNLWICEKPVYFKITTIGI